MVQVGSAKIPDAALSRIDYNYGNISPKIAEVNINKTSGLLPFTIKTTAEASDPDNGKLTYVWDLGNGTTKETTTPELEYTYDKAGDYKVSVEVKDDDGGSTRNDSKCICRQ
jgi:PKD repeat protein